MMHLDAILFSSACSKGRYLSDDKPSSQAYLDLFLSGVYDVLFT